MCLETLVKAPPGAVGASVLRVLELTQAIPSLRPSHPQSQQPLTPQRQQQAP